MERAVGEFQYDAGRDPSVEGGVGQRCAFCLGLPPTLRIAGEARLSGEEEGVLRLRIRLIAEDGAGGESEGQEEDPDAAEVF